MDNLHRAESRCMYRQLNTVCYGSLLLFAASLAIAEETPSGTTLASTENFQLSPADLELLDRTVERAVGYLRSNQSPDGSFASLPIGQPGITSLSCLAILSAGSVPDDSPEGIQLSRAIDFVLSTQQEDGLFSQIIPGRRYRPNNAAHAALYNHAMAGLLLTEVYGMTTPEQDKRIETAVTKALLFTRKFQSEEKRRDIDLGGWKYHCHSPHTPADSDLSVTAWQLMFLRSAKNAGFEVSENYAKEAVEYVNRCFDRPQKQFLYGVREPRPYTSRGITAAGIFALAIAGEHHTEPARLAADQLLTQPFEYNKVLTPFEQYHYSIYHSSQAMFQLGGSYWSSFFPPLLKSLAENQKSDGSWQASPGWERYGTPYTVALSVLALTPQYQVLPIYQR